ncbi:Anucleate primary sterigmata protein A [Erysiphe neolycopersici]|uniref:Anucleate primary sterigmata protein A n=1 Tax=Erysiphe neolycopersici TaxID=212602 RepID=A0A420HIV1_9PEZI|nr:Anucleate primary sterigmata protein A [Erysiphe neolycopersici]
MATLMGVNPPLGASNSKMSPSGQDPFISQASSSNHHRFANFDINSFSLSPATSPDQAKRALEAHLAETERRIQDASRLGTSLLQQRKELEVRLEEIEKQQNEENITPELRQKLQDIEKDYYEVGRESARAFLSKPRVLNNEISGSSARPISPFKERFESQGTGSPSKLNVTNRRKRNQPTNRVHDIEFATEISTSLLSQVRNLQALLAQKEDNMKTVMFEKSRLEIEIESYTDRLRSLDESGERYKDENWNLETQIQEYKTKEKEASDRERRLTQNFNIIQVEKTVAQKELDEIKSAYAKLLEEHDLALKHSDGELANIKRNLIEVETDRSSLQQKVDELLSQNMELVKAIAHQRGRLENINENYGLKIEDLEMAADDLTPEHSPPPSPMKGTPRHSHLESETLKSSLHHAHRMIQNLKSNIYREKTEKLELKRLLQDARDELEQRRGDMGQSGSKKARKPELKESKKQIKIDKLGGLRNSTSEVYLDESNWEDDNHDEQNDSGPTFGTSSGALPEKLMVTSHCPAWSTATTPAGTSDHFETANEQEVSDAFETADESTVQKDDLRGSQEALSEELTETEGDSAWQISNRTAAGNRFSFQSTGSTSDDDYHNGQEKFRTLNNTQTSRLRLKVNHSGNRQSRVSSEEPHFHGSPASFANSSRDGTPQAIGQSLFAELGDIVGSGEEEEEEEEEEFIDKIPHSFKDTPRSMRSNSSSRALRNRHVSPLVVSKPIMVDFGVMTELSEPELPINQVSALDIYESKPSNMISIKDILSLSHTSVATQIDSLINMTDASSQWSEHLIHEESTEGVHSSFNNTPRPMRSNSSLISLETRNMSPLVMLKPSMVDFGVMTEPWEPELPINLMPVLDTYESMPSDMILATDDPKICPSHISAATQTDLLMNMTDASSQWFENNILDKEETELRPNRAPTYSDMSSQCDLDLKDEKVAHVAELSTPIEIMGPPPISPNHGTKSNILSRPLTPNNYVPLSPSINDSPTPRPNQAYGAVSIRTPTRNNMKSIVSSMSSFASEIDNRFQMHNRLGTSTDVQSDIQSSTDPRMISAITQTMIGEYLWKYTRKTGRGVLSEKRHRRYFWVHPYTRTLYWSNRDPSLAGRAELKAKSVPIEAVRVVTDDNPMPPGLHRKSLIIMTPNRAVKFTATTGQRHETWFNSLSYLLLRTEEESLEDTSGIANESITSEDVAEFNPSCRNTHRVGTTSRQADHHYTNRIEPYTKNTHIIGSRSSRISVGNFSRLSSYWRPNREGLIGSMSSRQSKYSIDNIKSVYEESEVHDSAEDLREIIEKQDRESDKLENVRACCDGRHDVGHLHNSSRSRYIKTISTMQCSSRVESGVRYDTRNKCDKHLSNF